MVSQLEAARRVLQPSIMLPSRSYSFLSINSPSFIFLASSRRDCPNLSRGQLNTSNQQRNFLRPEPPTYCGISRRLFLEMTYGFAGLPAQPRRQRINADTSIHHYYAVVSWTHIYSTFLDSATRHAIRLQTRPVCASTYLSELRFRTELCQCQCRITLRCVALRCVALRCVALRCVALRCCVAAMANTDKTDNGHHGHLHCLSNKLQYQNPFTYFQYGTLFEYT